MRKTLIIWQRELSSSFLSPIAYVVIAVFLVVAGWTFLEAAESNAGSQESLEVLLFVSIFFWMPFFVTAITMRLFTEEKRSGTLETLMTAPVSDLAVVMGKFLGAFSFLFVVVAPAVGVIYILAAFSPGVEGVDSGNILGGSVILVVISSLCISIGLFVSLLTRNQIVAAICCFTAICFPFLIRTAVSNLPVGSDQMLEYLSAETHIVDFARGSIDTRPLVMYVSGTVFMLFAAVKALEARRWR
ncbi:MAG: ABC transporter permease [Kiritimatiellia bacterium]|nr:ABC transporter permease [Kiritimatiellia bacterium]MDP6848257.1 ABC transporter permease [Kiritimatiellia bacterium]